MALPEIDSLWDYNHPDDTERKFRDLILEAEQSGDKGYCAELITQIARCQGLQRHFDEAHRTLDQAVLMLNENHIRAWIRYLLERGRVFNSAGQPEQARPLFLRAWELGEAAGPDEAFYTIDAAHMLGIVGTQQEQLEWNLKAMALAERAGDPRANGWLGSLYNNLGWTYHDMKDYGQALDYFRRALQFRQEQGRTEEVRIARWCVGRVLRSMGRVDEALKIQTALRDEYEQYGEKSGYVYEELAECLLALGRNGESRQYFALAYRELTRDPYLAERETARLERLKRLAVPT
jgi:tetratricopeptide (TPR) repeat protein